MSRPALPATISDDFDEEVELTIATSKDCARPSARPSKTARRVDTSAEERRMLETDPRAQSVGDVDAFCEGTRGSGKWVIG